MNTALLLLVDGRFPAGGHAHSGGAEAAVKAGRIHDAESMTAFLTGRLHTAGLTAAGLAAAACQAAGDTCPSPDETEESYESGGAVGPREPGGPVGSYGPDGLRELDEAAEARTASPALRAVSRRLGRQLLRAARAAWPHPVLERLAEQHPGGAHHPVVLGVTAYAAGLTPQQAALAAAYESVNGPATACVRLLGLDPYQVAAALAGLAPQVDAVAAEATRAAAQRELPAASAPLLDVYAEQHSTWKVRLFAS